MVSTESEMVSEPASTASPEMMTSTAEPDIMFISPMSPSTTQATIGGNLLIIIVMVTYSCY